MIYFTADTHFSHKNIIDYCDRPFESTKQMDKVLIANWNAVVSPEDTVYHLGDVTMSTDKNQIHSWLNKLNGKKHLILGNHDKLDPFEYVEAGFASVHTSLELDEFVLVHDPALANAIPGDKHVLCGHVHTLFDIMDHPNDPNKKKKVINVGVDIWGFQPIHIHHTQAICTGGYKNE